MMPSGLMSHNFLCKPGANMTMLLPGEGKRIRRGQAIGSGKRASVKLDKKVWVRTQNKEVMTASVERGWNTFVFTPETESLVTSWQALSRIRPVILRDEVFTDLEGNAVALLGQVTSGLGQENVKALVGQSETVVMSALDWQIITAENMVAAFQDTNTSLFATAANAHEARLYFEALEKGTDGVVLQTEDPAEVVSLKAYLASRSDEENRISLQVGTVVRVEPTGLGDRVCVDLCNIMNPGEGLLVGSFARGLFLVHSECLTSDYVASRPFRVNAGPVHAYVAIPGGRTSYLCELRSGTEVLAVNAEGKTRPVTVGRVKIESRPLMLVEVEFEGTTYSLFLQNAETVCLVSPSASDVPSRQDRVEAAALPVTRLKAGDKVVIGLQGGARHTGLEIDEFIVEK
ncbi:hypothetical protein R1flu_018186 [Riccia fluitans]|uniref:3-dehydroquinate synthase n=1 Tax=Riccia fluitans TaxID=41844 RepID=A0ABD1ZFB0_9MARC